MAPPKPWERTGSMLATTTALSSSSSSLAATTANVPSSLSSATTMTTGPTTQPSMPPPPSIPDRPAPLASTSSSLPYSSPYSRLGGGYGVGYNSAYGSNYGYGGTYSGLGSYGLGSYGYGYGGIGGMGMGMGMGVPNSLGLGGVGGGLHQPFIGPDGHPLPPSLSQTLESTTHHTFALLHSIVQTFTGMAQMLESTFMATHSSFFAMVGVVDQFTQLRNALGGVLGLFGLVKWLKEMVLGRPSLSSSSSSSMNSEFREFINGRPVQGPSPSSPPPPKASKKLIIIFLLAIFGIPYAMNKLIRLLQERAAEAQAGAASGNLALLPPLDRSSLTFARALYPFAPSNSTELALKDNEIVAITGKIDPRTGAVVDPRLEVEGGEWWKGRTRDGREGWFPKKWVEVLQKRKADEPKKVD